MIIFLTDFIERALVLTLGVFFEFQSSYEKKTNQESPVDKLHLQL
jgi:hypothetical protein